MTTIQDKLLDCMRAVFPNVADGQLIQATVENLEQWDSLATVTLAALIEETFAIEIEPENLVSLTSFQNIVAFLTAEEQR